MARPYRSARELLDDVVNLAFDLAMRQITVYTEAGFLPRPTDEFSGTYVAFADVRTLIEGGRPPSEDALAKVAELDAAITASAEHIDARLDASRAAGTPMPLDELQQQIGLTPTEFRSLCVLIALETNQRMRQLLRYLVNDSARVHADIGLLEMLVYQAPALRERWVKELAPDAPLFRFRLVEPIGRGDEPFLMRQVRLSPRVIETAVGMTRLDPQIAPFADLIDTPRPFDELDIPPETKAHVQALLDDALSAGRVGVRRPIVLVQGPEGSGRRTLLEGAAAALNQRVLRVRCADLPREPGELARIAQAIGREALLANALLLLDGIDHLAADTESARLDRAAVIDRAIIDPFHGAIAAVGPKADARPVRLARGFVPIELTTPTETVRQRLWRKALGEAAAPDVADRAAARYPLTGGVIERAAESAKVSAQAKGALVSPDDVHEGVRSTLDAKMSSLGVRLAWKQQWSDLVLPEDANEEIREFIARVRHKRQVYEQWGFGRKIAKGLGLSALFSGPPGTGKTMVAGLIADELSLDLYQIDLSRIVSKYVGETEKNLANLFDAAESGHAVILFDEADSLFAKRTEVKSSVDRYANLEVNYLLQRMEAFAGIVILTTNLDTSIDEAFRRRLSFRITFPLPESPEREKLWRALLPTEAAVAPGIDFKALAERFAMSGGYIKNAVLRAAFLAADEQKPIGQQHLLRAGLLEYAAMGKVMHAGGKK